MEHVLKSVLEGAYARYNEHLIFPEDIMEQR